MKWAVPLAVTLSLAASGNAQTNPRAIVNQSMDLIGELEYPESGAVQFIIVRNQKSPSGTWRRDTQTVHRTSDGKIHTHIGRDGFVGQSGTDLVDYWRADSTSATGWVEIVETFRHHLEDAPEAFMHNLLMPERLGSVGDLIDEIDSAYTIAAERVGGSQLHLVIAKGDYRLLEFHLVRDGVRQISFVYSDHRRALGALVPHRVQAFRNGDHLSTQEIVEIRAVRDVPASLFEPPGR